MLGESGEVVELVGTAVDVTEHRFADGLLATDRARATRRDIATFFEVLARTDGAPAATAGAR